MPDDQRRLCLDEEENNRSVRISIEEMVRGGLTGMHATFSARTKRDSSSVENPIHSKVVISSKMIRGGCAASLSAILEEMVAWVLLSTDGFGGSVDGST